MPDLVAECLGLRRWVIPLLAKSASPETCIARKPRVSIAGWTHFLAAEAIAQPLHTRLGSAVALFTPDERSVLESAVRGEVQRVMSARAQLFAIDGVAAGLGIKPIVLKGGVAAVDGSESFDLADVDLMMSASEIRALEQALIERAGYRLDPANRLISDGAIPVELHDALEVGYGMANLGEAGVAPLGSFRSLQRQVPTAHVLYILQHVATKHVMRRGHLRDVLALATALDSCSETDVQSVRRAIESSDAREPYGALLDFAETMRAGAPGGDARDPFARIAACKYAMTLHLRSNPRAFPVLIEHTACFTASPRDAWRLVTGYLRSPDYEGTHWYSTKLARVSPALARGVGMTLRTPYRLAALGRAFATAMAISTVYAVRWRQP